MIQEEDYDKLINDHIFWKPTGEHYNFHNGWQYYRTGNSGHEEPVFKVLVGSDAPEWEELKDDGEDFDRAKKARLKVKRIAFEQAAYVYLYNTDPVLKLMILTRKFAEREINTNFKIKHAVFNLMKSNGNVHESISYDNAYFQDKKWIEFRYRGAEHMEIFDNQMLGNVLRGKSTSQIGNLIESEFPDEKGDLQKGLIPENLVIHHKEQGWLWVTDKVIFDDPILNDPFVKQAAFKRAVFEDSLPNALIFKDGKCMWNMSANNADIWNTMISKDEYDTDTEIIEKINKEVESLTGGVPPPSTPCSPPPVV